MRRMSAPSGSAGPLAGIRVLELGSFIAGPFAGQLLGDYGAEVIKVEPPGDGDPMRRWGVTATATGLWWPAIARNKRSVAIDLRDGGGHDSSSGRLAAQCDVVLENFRPGRLDEWGLGYARALGAQPGAHRGPRVRLRADRARGLPRPGSAASARRWAASATPPASPDRPPARSGISLGDSLAGLFAVIGALAALDEARPQRSRPGGRRRDLRGGRCADGVRRWPTSRLGGVCGPGQAACSPASRRRTSTPPPTAPTSSIAGQRRRRVPPAVRGDGTARPGRQIRGIADHGARGRHMAELDADDRGLDRWRCRRLSCSAVLAAHGVPAGKIFTAADMVGRSALRGTADGPEAARAAQAR